MKEVPEPGRDVRVHGVLRRQRSAVGCRCKSPTRSGVGQQQTVAKGGFRASWQTVHHDTSRTFMVFVSVTSVGLTEALRRATSEDAIWCGSDTIFEAEYAQMKRPGLTRFNYSLAGLELDDGAIATVKEHHPDQTIWVEAAPRS
jgi:hypothetical protein